MILYLGLDPSRYVHTAPLWHYPLIRTEKLASPHLEQALQAWASHTHAIFTSREAVRYWFELAPVGTHQVFAVGHATALALRDLGIEPLVAQEETQEGIMALLDSVQEAKIFWPRSNLARPNLESYLQKRAFPYFAFDLYTTVFQEQIKITDWSAIAEIVFTSPSTVEAFYRLYGALPGGVRGKTLGPITQKAFATFEALTYNEKNFDEAIDGHIR